MPKHWFIASKHINFSFGNVIPKSLPSPMAEILYQVIGILTEATVPHICPPSLGPLESSGLDGLYVLCGDNPLML